MQRISSFVAIAAQEVEKMASSLPRVYRIKAMTVIQCKETKATERRSDDEKLPPESLPESAC